MHIWCGVFFCCTHHTQEQEDINKNELSWRKKNNVHKKHKYYNPAGMFSSENMVHTHRSKEEKNGISVHIGINAVTSRKKTD